MTLFMAALSGALLGFLFYNFNPASIFMGDTGSMFLGFVIAVTAVQTSTKGATTVALLTPVLAVGLPIMDTLLAMLRRFARGQSMFSADREHIHHRLLAMGLSHRRVVVIMYGASLAFALVALFITFNGGPRAALVLVGMAGITAVLMRRIGFFQVPRLTDLAATRRRNGRLRVAGREAKISLREARDEQGLIGCLADYGVAIGAEHVRVVHSDGSVLEERLADDADVDGRAFSTGFAVPEADWILELTWFDGRRELALEKQLAVQSFVGEVRDAHERIQGRRRLRAVS